MIECAYHAVGEEGITFHDIAEAIGRKLNLPLESCDRDHFGWSPTSLAPTCRRQARSRASGSAGAIGSACSDRSRPPRRHRAPILRRCLATAKVSAGIDVGRTATRRTSRGGCTEEGRGSQMLVPAAKTGQRTASGVAFRRAATRTTSRWAGGGNKPAEKGHASVLGQSVDEGVVLAMPKVYWLGTQTSRRFLALQRAAVRCWAGRTALS